MNATVVTGNKCCHAPGYILQKYIYIYIYIYTHTHTHTHTHTQINIIRQSLTQHLFYIRWCICPALDFYFGITGNDFLCEALLIEIDICTF